MIADNFLALYEFDVRQLCFLCPSEWHDDTCVATDPLSIEQMEGFFANDQWDFGFFFFFLIRAVSRTH